MLQHGVDVQRIFGAPGVGVQLHFVVKAGHLIPESQTIFTPCAIVQLRRCTARLKRNTQTPQRPALH